MLKKLFKIISILFIAFPAMIICLFFICPVIDNIALENYKKEVLNTLNLPPDTVIIEAVSGCGNTSGTGNHTELYVAVLVKTALSEHEWKSANAASHDVVSERAQTSAMSLVGVSFSQINDPEGYYIFEFTKNAPCSDFDLRGH